MTFDEVLDQVRELLQQRGRVTYRSLKLRYQLDEELLAGVTDELISAERVAVDEEGKVLVWIGKGEKEVVSPQLSVLSSPPPPISQTPNPELRTSQPPSGERRQLTVQFIDLVGSTTLSQQLDPEDYHARVVAYQTACHHVIARYEGYIAQYLGDGVLVYFGYPIAHEDDAVRAVRSGLEIIAAVSQLTYTPPLQVRIGIHTGPVMIGEIGAGEHTERLALGETPNIAARVQGLANPDEVVISAATHRLVEGLFVCEDRGQPELKGVAVPLTLYWVEKESEAQSRFQVVARQGLTPLIGREHEYGLLQDRWQRVQDGAGQIVLLSGEPGIGKSRLVEALKERVEHEGARCLELRCSPYAQNSALQPVIEHLQRTLQFQPEDTADEKLHKLEQRLAHSSLDLQEAMPLFAALLSLPAPRSLLPALSPQKQKEKTYEALVAWLWAGAKQQSMMYAWEDLHWADPSTLELLTLFLAQVPTTRLLAVLTYRPEFTPPWGSYSYLSQLTLSRLAQSHVEVMVNKITDSKVLPVEIVRQITSKTDGVPLFVEELTKMVAESGLVTEVNGHYELTGPLPLLAIPSTLHDSLMARLDRLGTTKEIAQLGATIGREFNYELLQAVSLLDGERLQYGLKQLVDAELLYQRGVPSQATYLFKHALIQDTAYQSLLKSRRQQYHQQIAHVLEARFPETKETQPELLTHHYIEANRIAQAIPYWQQAGQKAIRRSANVEANSHLTKGLGLLKTLPDTPERVQQELTFQITLGSALAVTKGYAAPEVKQAYTRARELCQQLGETSQLFPVLWGLWDFYLVRAELQTARELGEQLLSLAQRVQDPVLLLEAHDALGQTLCCLGEFTAARAHLEEVIALYDPRQHRSLAFLYGGEDPGVLCLCYVGRILWTLGYPEQALRRIHEAFTLAQELSHSHSLAIALWFAAMVHQHRLEGQATQEWAEAAIRLATEQGFPSWLAWGTALRGWALAEQGQEEGGIAQVRWSMTAWQGTGAEAGRTYYLALLAEAYGKAGQADKGLAALADAPAMVEKTGDRWWEAELYRLKGELTLKKGAGDWRLGAGSSSPQAPRLKPQVPSWVMEEAEECFHKAIAVARRQQAKSLELRATVSLARLWQRQGKKEDAHHMLADIYGWFTEGFDTKDLQEAKVLLDSLESSV